MDIERVAIDSVRTDAGNVRKHGKKNLDTIKRSLESFGQQKPIVVGADGVVVAGNGTLDAALALGWTHIDVVRTGLEGSARKAYAVADNRTAELAEWDDTGLAEYLAGLKADETFDETVTGFDAGEIERLIGTPEIVEDETPPVPETPVTKLGDLWLLGDHRVLCGDATKGEDVKALMAGAVAQMVFTDPPYGVGYSGGAKVREHLRGDDIGTSIYAAALPMLAFAADDAAPLYLWYADGHAAAAAAAAAGYQIVAQVIWAKNHAQFVTSAHYKGKHEPCYYGHRRGKTARWYGPNNEVTLWECDRSPRNDYHPTQKPVLLAVRAIRNSSCIGEIVLDLFLGSGTTLIAAEQLGRRCYGIEIEPKYVDVTLKRWANLTGKSPVREADGVPFADLTLDNP